MKSSELADYVRRLVKRSGYAVMLGSSETDEIAEQAAGRILGVGRDQYEEDEDTQKFETMDLDNLFQYLDEELLDQINYGAMLRIRVSSEPSPARLGEHWRLLEALESMVDDAEANLVRTRRAYTKWKEAEVQA